MSKQADTAALVLIWLGSTAIVAFSIYGIVTAVGHLW